MKKPKRTVVCTHDPCDAHYKNTDEVLTEMLRKWPFKAHYHAHIHSNLRKIMVGVTPSVNRSFVALARFRPEALEPAMEEVRALYRRDV